MAWQETMMRFRLAEFATSTLMLVISLVISLAGLYQRDLLVVTIPLGNGKTVFVRDPSVNLPMLDQQVPMYLAVILSYGIPVIAHVVLQCKQRIDHDTRDFFLSLFVSSAICQLATNILKVLAGRFRPSFYSMCKWDTTAVWDGSANLCTDKHAETEGRKSFPSGHSSTAFSTLFFLSLYLLGRFQVVALHKYSANAMAGRHSLANIKFFIALLPTVLAMWIAVTRSMDNWHHYSDIAAGAFIGIVSAVLAYAYNYGSLFKYKSSGLPLETYYEQKIAKSDSRVAPLTAA
ncbi:hypothetical protein SDRG_06893 [Saprolegnia diclina VS20]|uniref:Phosphatidic acid phosphatase type 2/haloperoxidase domain-containing protein n=1 Tax=Saprolegnia diclina (strain VS20) TaxID=1156394 RepID=T0RT46_SAPDV|nr:hypothetical protein SDRG_06893 [Saprolegnia diclina VS20]EQC35608.1 hypothetical protein SDRG_06893 [Saprolegnia diclina VS20]|eukprot:XP_008610925.1 hypothetical protein SDRG_06893 [Saprolegnia diclina VS20]